MTKEDKRDTILWVAACVGFLTGIGLVIAGFIVPPIGFISGSVLTALGEFLTFFCSVFGIGKYTEIQIEKIKQKSADKNN